MSELDPETTLVDDSEADNIEELSDDDLEGVAGGWANGGGGNGGSGSGSGGG